MLGVPKDTLYGWTKAEERRKIFGSDSSVTEPMTDTEKEIAELIIHEKSSLLITAEYLGAEMRLGL